MMAERSSVQVACSVTGFMKLIVLINHMGLAYFLFKNQKQYCMTAVVLSSGCLADDVCSQMSLLIILRVCECLINKHSVIHA